MSIDLVKMQAEIDRLRILCAKDNYPIWQEGYNVGWSNAIEECARVAEKHLARYDHMEHVAAAIRALKDKA